MSLREIVVSGEDALQVADALTSSSLRVLQLLSKERLDVSTIAERLKLSQPYISEQVRKLEEANLVRVSYGRGKRGVRKICELAVKKIVIVIKPQATPTRSRRDLRFPSQTPASQESV